METIPSLLLANSANNSKAPALRHKQLGIWHSYTWSEYLDEVLVIAKALKKDVSAGGVVAIYGNNTPELIFSMAATFGLGGSIVPIHPEATTKELSDIISKSGATVLIVEDQQQVDNFLEIESACKSVKKVIYVNERGLGEYKDSRLQSLEKSISGKLSVSEFTSLVKKVNQKSAAFISYSEEDQEIYKISHASAIANSKKIAESNGITIKDTILFYLPLSITANLVFTYMLSFVKGVCLSCPESNQTIETDLQEIGPTILYAPSFVYRHIITSISYRIEAASAKNYKRYSKNYDSLMRIYKKSVTGKSGIFDSLMKLYLMLTTFLPAKNVFGLSNVKHAFVSDGVLSPSTFDFFHSIGLPIQHTFGQTQSVGCITMQSKDAVSARNCGPALSNVKIKKSDDGEILYKSDCTAEPNSGEWIKTGHCGDIDKDGNLIVTGRLNSIETLKNGKSFSPEYIENLISCSPFIRSAMVSGDGEKNNSCLVVIEGSSVNSWADRMNLRYTGYAELSSLDEVYNLVKKHIKDVNKELDSDLKIKSFAILHRQLTVAEGEVSKTMDIIRKVSRKNLSDVFSAFSKGDKSCKIIDANKAEYNIKIEGV